LWQKDESACANIKGLASAAEGQRATEDVENLVFGRMRMVGRFFALTRSILGHGCTPTSMQLTELHRHINAISIRPAFPGLEGVWFHCGTSFRSPVRIIPGVIHGSGL
jgi:hypothetical protein